MRYPPLVEGRLVRRYKRFLADVELAGGEVVTAHCANPGRMTTCAVRGGRVWLSESDDPRRKLRHTWELAEIDGELLSVNTGRSNRVVEEALVAGALPELGGHRELRREVARGASRIDFALEGEGGRVLLEVKTVTLAVAPGVCAFPDSVTARGRRHLEELIAARARGERAALLFFCARANAELIRPADEIDPDYGAALRRAAAAGVEIYGRGCAISLREIRIGERLPVELQ